MRIAFGCDHGGLILREPLIKWLESHGHTVVDCGATSYNASDDYPDFARAVGEAIQQGRAERAVLVCGSGIGASIAASKLRGVRAAVAHDVYSAHQGVEHDDMNVLTLGARVIGDMAALELVNAFVNARFSGEPRHQRRLDKVAAMEKDNDGKR